MSEPVCIRDFAPLARAKLDEQTWNYVESGSGDEHTLRWNEQAWADTRLAPRVAVDVSAIDTTLTLFGHRLAHPILLAPTAAHAQYHSGAERETLRGADAADAIATLSTLGSTRFGDLAGGTARWWMQLYVQPDRHFTRDLVQSAVDAGAGAVLVTVDLPVPGARDRDRRIGGQTLDVLEPPNLQGAPRPFLNAALTWADVAEVCSMTTVPVLAKGVLRPDDAVRAIDAGCAGIVVSNHGARGLDTVPATAHALKGVVDEVAGRIPVLVDGGLRRGTDIATALCLGASAVLIGRPYVWGLAVAGGEGVATVVDILRTELGMAMAGLGATTLRDLGPDLIWP